MSDRSSHRLRTGILAALIALLVGGIALEIMARLVTVSNGDGQRFFLNVPLRPFRLPVEETRSTLVRYRQTVISELIYDPILGWTNRPDLPDYNAAGLRADHEYASQPADGVLRIAAFGDSFTHGNEVSPVDSWARQLEARLAAQSVSAEVLNFGVGGYGIDQAYLRWQAQGVGYHPDIVLLGYVSVDVSRLVNLYWKFQPSAIAVPGANPFTKPRYTLEDGALHLINSPTVTPDALPDFLASFPSSDLAPYESAFDPENYAERWWLNSSLLATLDGLQRYLTFDPARSPALALDVTHTAPDAVQEADQLALAILDKWSADAANAGSRFVIVNLPLQAEVRTHQSGGQLADDGLRRSLQAQYEWIETLDAFPTADLGAMFAPGGHYAPSGNAIIAEVIAASLVETP